MNGELDLNINNIIAVVYVCLVVTAIKYHSPSQYAICNLLDFIRIHISLKHYCSRGMVMEGGGDDLENTRKLMMRRKLLILARAEKPEA